MLKKPRLDREKRIPYYKQCASFIQQSIEEGRYAIGEFLPPERALSRQFGVNRLTLRKGLAELLREGILESVPGAGNRVVMKQGKVQKSRMIGCLMNRMVDVRTLSPYYADIFSGVENEITDSGYNLVFSAIKWEDLRTADGTVRIVPQAVNKRFAGVLIIGGLPDELALTYHRKGVKVVLIDKHMSKKDISCVVPDNKAGTLDLARYLVNLGHRRIAFLGAAKDPVVDLRFNTFIQVLKDAGCSFQSGDYITGGYEIKPACIAVKQYLSSKRNNKPSAIFAINDEAAIGAMKALQEQGLRVPEDISVTGYDDISWAAHTIPPLTTVRIPREEMGRMAAQLLVGQIESRQTSSTITALNTELVVRESCAPVH